MDLPQHQSSAAPGALRRCTAPGPSSSSSSSNFCPHLPIDAFKNKILRGKKKEKIRK